MFVGPSKWRWSGDWVCEPDECFGEGEIEIDPEEWEEMSFLMKCTECGADLDPFCDHFVADTGETSYALYQRIMA